MTKSLLGRVALATLVGLPTTVLAAAPDRGAQGVERDDANVRRKGMARFYETPMSPAFKRFMNQAAAAERAKFRGEQFGSPEGHIGDPGASLEAVATGNWTNIGPTGSNYIQNGGYSLTAKDSGRAVDIVTDPTNASTIYLAVSGGGVWKTTTGGTSWAPLTEGLGSLSVGALEMDPASASTLYLGLGDSFDGTGLGLVKSTDGGATWSTVRYLGGSSIITKIQVSRTSSSIVLATTDKGLFRSTDAGLTWSAVALSTGFADAPYAWDMAHAGGTSWVLSLEATPAAASGTTNGQIWRSSNDGASWTKATGVTKTGGVGRISLASAPTNRLTVYAMAAVPNAASSADLADFFRSTDGGTSFAALGATGRRVTYSNKNTESTAPSTVLNGQGWYNHMLIVDPANANTFYFGGALLMAKATLTGSTWSYTQLTNWLAQFSLPYVHADFHAAAFGADGTFYVGSDGGIFKKTATGWVDLNGGISTHLLYSVGSSPANRAAVIGGLQDNGTRVRVGSTGVYNQEIGGDGFGAAIHPTDANVMLGSLYYSRIQKSTDGGLNFVSACTGITECNNSGTAPFNTVIVPWSGDASGNTVYTHTNSKVYKSTNFGGSWTAVGTAFASGIYLRNVGVAHSNSSVIGVVASGGRTYLSNNGGASWTLHTLPNNGLSMQHVAFDRSNANVVYVASVAPDGTKSHLWKTTDFGATWAAIDGNGLPAGVPVNSIVADPGDGNVLYAATHLGVYKSINQGGAWARFGGSTLPLVNVTSLYISPDSSLMRAATFGRGFWELVP